ncbi:MAG TPA: heat-inducible transcription repressor HrcA [Clostridiales bacterium]|jgi:heat-inducible transcriptional repressor|nr:heat-inducible transcription repressor HrcA [Clostridiales bacterium]
MSSLTARKAKILKSIVEDYINQAEPISSSDIKDRHLPEISSATIRNELAALEEMGYLYQPHTSSGRIPTKEAYKLYVEKLMPRKKLSKAELNLIKSHFNQQMLQLKDVLKKTAKVISEVTNYTSLAFVNDISEAVIENIKIVKLQSKTALVIVVTNLGVLKDAIVNLEEEMDDSYFDAVSKLSLQVFGGKKIAQVMKPNKIINTALKGYQKIFDAIIDIIKKYYERVGVEDFVLEGASKLLEQPEYSNVQQAKSIIAMLEAKEQLLPALKTTDNVELNIRIGKDERYQSLPECAIVTANYIVNGKNIGQAGVVGPIRMDYSKVVSVLDYIGKTINDSIQNRINIFIDEKQK